MAVFRGAQEKVGAEVGVMKGIDGNGSDIHEKAHLTIRLIVGSASPRTSVDTLETIDKERTKDVWEGF